MRAMVLAAGLGSRLGEITKSVPKCLVDINGQPMIALTLAALRKAGVREVVVNLHYLPGPVRDFLQDGSHLGMKVEYSFEPKLLGTGGAVKAARHLFAAGEPLMVVNADIYTDFPLSSLVAAMNSKADVVAILAVMKRSDSSYLLLDEKKTLLGWDNGVVHLHHPQPAAHSPWGFCGLQVLRPEMLNYLYQDPREEFSIIDSYMRALRDGKEIHCVDIEPSFWVDIGTPAQLDQLRRRMI